MPNARRTWTHLWSTAAPILVVISLLTVGCQEARPPAPAETRPAFLDELAQMEFADEPLPPGEPMPELVAEGWINGEPPNLSGKIVVLEAWAHW